MAERSDAQYDIDENATDIAANTTSISSLVSPIILQVVNTSTPTVITNAVCTVMPYDNTKPQITEGDQYLSRTVTPTTSGNLLKIDITMDISCGSG